MLIALVLTWLNQVVLLYLFVLVSLIAGFSVAFMIGFGLEDPNFSTFPRALLSLFRIGLSQDWSRFDLYVPHSMQLLLHLHIVLT